MCSHNTQWPPHTSPYPALGFEEFCDKVRRMGKRTYRDFPWRNTRDPYAIWVSEVMLQQTQVTRVDGRWQRWLERFPTVEELAGANQTDVLVEWQGMGYNRRALSLMRAAQQISQMGSFPREVDELKALPGIGPATAAGIRAFAFDLPGVYLETNVRTVFLHDLFPEEVGVADRTLQPLVEATCPSEGVRDWYYALLDYGAWLKKTVPNPSRRSRTHTHQSRFEGSHRQRRAQILRMLLSAGQRGLCEQDICESLGFDAVEVHNVLEELCKEGFCTNTNNCWFA